jgi:hypothetical protein
LTDHSYTGWITDGTAVTIADPGGALVALWVPFADKR